MPAHREPPADDQGHPVETGPDTGGDGDAHQDARRGQRRTGGDVPPPWLRTSAVLIGAVLATGLLLLLAAATLPSWWAGLVGRQVDGVPAAGVLWGLVYGVTLTVVPMALVLLAVRSRWHWKVRLGVGIGALVVLVPNLLTLAVAAGATENTRAARTVLAVQAPNFRIATLIGVLVTLALGAVIILVAYRMTASRRELQELRKQAGQQ